jgi:5-methylcytosine-specific restriction endonuclease McrA
MNGNDSFPEENHVYFKKNSVKKIKGITREQKYFITEKQRGRCAGCGMKVELSDGHIHHIRPLNKGGTNTTKNLILVCSNCHTKLPE